MPDAPPVARCAAVAHSSATRRVRSAAFSLIELLVVIAIIGVLLGLLVPAVQASREASRKTVCGNNLRQAGLAMQAHAASHGAYPAGYVSKVKPNGDDAGPGWAWGSKLLPMMEQREVFEQIDFESPVESPASEAVRMTSLPVFICPSDSGFERVIDIKRHAAFKVTCKMAAASYVGSAGTVRATCLKCRDQFDGVFGRNHPIKPADVLDGTSNTLAIGERATLWANSVMWGVVAGSKMFDNQRPTQYAAGPAFVLGTTFRDGFNICETQYDDPNSAETYAESFGSMHPGGSHFTFCDGGMRFVFETVDPGVMNALATRDTVAREGKVDPIIHESPF